MGHGIGGALPRDLYTFRAVPHYRNRRTYFTVESHAEVDQTNAGRARTFSTKAKADNRADALNRERTAHQQANRRGS